FSGPSRIAGDDDMIARLQRVARDARQLTGGRPFDRPALHLALGVRRLHVQEGVWVSEHELQQVAFDRDLLVDLVDRGKRVVSGGRGSGAGRGGENAEDKTFHSSSSRNSHGKS